MVNPLSAVKNGHPASVDPLDGVEGVLLLAQGGSHHRVDPVEHSDGHRCLDAVEPVGVLGVPSPELCARVVEGVVAADPRLRGVSPSHVHVLGTRARRESPRASSRWGRRRCGPAIPRAESRRPGGRPTACRPGRRPRPRVPRRPVWPPTVSSGRWAIRRREGPAARRGKWTRRRRGQPAWPRRRARRGCRGGRARRPGRRPRSRPGRCRDPASWFRPPRWRIALRSSHGSSVTCPRRSTVPGRHAGSSRRVVTPGRRGPVGRSNGYRHVARRTETGPPARARTEGRPGRCFTVPTPSRLNGRRSPASGCHTAAAPSPVGSLKYGYRHRGSSSRGVGAGGPDPGRTAEGGQPAEPVDRGPLDRVHLHPGTAAPDRGRRAHRLGLGTVRGGGGPLRRGPWATATPRVLALRRSRAVRPPGVRTWHRPQPGAGGRAGVGGRGRPHRGRRPRPRRVVGRPGGGGRGGHLPVRLVQRARSSPPTRSTCWPARC